MTRFAALDLSRLPRPATYAATHEAILDARMAAFVAAWEAERARDPSLPAYDVTRLQTDPVKLVERTDAYRELLVLQQIDDAVAQTSLAYATGAALDVKAADYMTPRAAGESDASLRSRAQMAWEALSIGGSYGGYEYRARAVAPVEIADVAVYGHEAPGVARGEVRVVVLGAAASGRPGEALLSRIRDALSPRTARKTNDFVQVVGATLAPYEVDATLVLRPGADPQAVVAAQSLRLAAYCRSRRTIDGRVTLGGLVAALGDDNSAYVDDVVLRSPVAAVGGGPFDAPILAGARVLWEPAS